MLRTYPGFPAFGALKPGDLILGIKAGRVEDRSLDYVTFQLNGGTDEIEGRFRDLVQTVNSGEVIGLYVIRGGKKLKINVPLASLDALRNIYVGTSGELQPRFRQRWQSFLNDLKGLKAAGDALAPRKNPAD